MNLILVAPDTTRYACMCLVHVSTPHVLVSESDFSNLGVLFIACALQQAMSSFLVG